MIRQREWSLRLVHTKQYIYGIEYNDEIVAYLDLTQKETDYIDIYHVKFLNKKVQKVLRGLDKFPFTRLSNGSWITPNEIHFQGYLCEIKGLSLLSSLIYPEFTFHRQPLVLESLS
jgi:hypothetical protein